MYRVFLKGVIIVKETIKLSVPFTISFPLISPAFLETPCTHKNHSLFLRVALKKRDSLFGVIFKPICLLVLQASSTILLIFPLVGITKKSDFFHFSGRLENPLFLFITSFCLLLGKHHSCKNYAAQTRNAFPFCSCMFILCLTCRIPSLFRVLMPLKQRSSFCVVDLVLNVFIQWCATFL